MSSASATTSELHPRIRELIDYVDEHRRNLHEAVASIPAKLRETTPSDGAWSVANVIEHVSLIEGRIAMLVAKHASVARATGVGPDPDTSSVVASYANPERVVDRSAKIVAPPAVAPTGALDAAAGTQALHDSHALLVSSLRDANGVSLESSMQTHPILGPLNIYHWIVATALHDDRHAAQIREIGKSLGAD